MDKNVFETWCALNRYPTVPHGSGGIWAKCVCMTTSNLFMFDVWTLRYEQSANNSIRFHREKAEKLLFIGRYTQSKASGGCPMSLVTDYYDYSVQWNGMDTLRWLREIIYGDESILFSDGRVRRVCASVYLFVCWLCICCVRSMVVCGDGIDGADICSPRNGKIQQ